MSDYEIKVGSTNIRIPLWLADSSSTTGGGLTGLTSGSAGLTCYAHREDDGNAAGVQLVLGAGTRGTYSSGGFVEKDSTNMPGDYELGLATAQLAAGSKWVQLVIKGATNLAVRKILIRLTAYDPDSATDLGLSKLTSLTFTVANKVDANTIAVSGTTQTARDLGASVLLSAGTGAGQLDFTSGVVKSNLVQVLGTVLTEVAGQIAGGIKQFFNIATPAATMDHGVLVDTVTTLTTKTGFALTAAYDPAKTAAQAGDAMTLTAVYNAAKTASQAGDAMTLTAAYDAAKTAATQATATAIKTQTDKMTFTVAGIQDVNIMYVHSIQLKGSGTAIDPWAPA